MPTLTEGINIEVGANIQKFQDGMRKVETQTQATGRKMDDTFKRVAGSVGLLTASIGSLATASQGAQILGQFQLKMAEVETIVDTTAVSMDKLDQAIINMLRDVPQTEQELGAGLYQVFSSGVTEASDALNVLETSAVAATAGLTNTFVAVDATTTVLNAYNKSADEARRINELFFETVRSGKITYEQLAQGIGEVATSAAVADVSIEEITAAVATMTQSGISAAETMTSLNSLILKIVQPTEEAREAAKQYGIDLSAAGIQADGLQGILRKLNDAVGDNVEALTEVIPDIRSFRAAAILAGQGAQTYQQNLQNMRGELDQLDDAFETINSTMLRQADILRNNVVASFLELASKLEGPVGGSLQAVNRQWDQSVETLGLWLSPVGEAIDLGSQVAESLGRMASSQEDVVTATERSRDNITKFDGGINTLSGHIERNVEGLREMAQLIERFNQLTGQGQGRPAIDIPVPVDDITEIEGTMPVINVKLREQQQHWAEVSRLVGMVSSETDVHLENAQAQVNITNGLEENWRQINSGVESTEQSSKNLTAEIWAANTAASSLSDILTAMIFKADSLGDAMRGIAQGIFRTALNFGIRTAIGAATGGPPGAAAGAASAAGAPANLDILGAGITKPVAGGDTFNFTFNSQPAQDQEGIRQMISKEVPRAVSDRKRKRR